MKQDHFESVVTIIWGRDVSYIDGFLAGIHSAILLNTDDESVSIWDDLRLLMGVNRARWMIAEAA